MATLLVAHGTRNPHGVRMIGDLAAAMAGVLDETVRVAFVDVLGPAPDEVLRILHDEPTVLVPALLSSGYHVRADVPRHVTASGHPAVTVTPALGPSSGLTSAMLDRLLEAGWRAGDHVVLAAAGTSDPCAQRDVAITAAMLSALVAGRVSIASPRRPAMAAATRRCPRRWPGRAGRVPPGSRWPHTCWRTACFRVGCTRRGPTWWARRWARIPRWSGSPACGAGTPTCSRPSVRRTARGCGSRTGCRGSWRRKRCRPPRFGCHRPGWTPPGRPGSGHRAG